MTDNELILFDRLEVIRAANKKYDLEKNAYISFSGGKDSTVLHYLMDEALPGNKIPRVFSNTGIEYKAIADFVQQMVANDERFEIITPKVKIREMLEEVGYPFKSKEHSNKVYEYQIGHGHAKSIEKYATQSGAFCCPDVLRYQFTDKFKMKISHKCCYELKKRPFKQWMKEKKRTTTITGMQKGEGGSRINRLHCITEKNDKLLKFHPLAVITDEWEEWFIKERKIKLCELYYPPYNFKRTGCKGCPYSPDLQNQLDLMAMYLPAEKKQCEIIWAPVYAEYRRLGYRLRKPDGQMSLFD